MFIVVSELPNHPEIHLEISRISSATKVSFLLCDYGSSETELCCRCCKMRFMMLFLHRYQLYGVLQMLKVLMNGGCWE